MSIRNLDDVSDFFHPLDSTALMKVLHMVPAMEQGGVETVVLSLNAALVAEGWESVVVSRGGRLVPRVGADGGSHVFFDLKSKNPLTYPVRVWRLRQLLKREKPDLVCAHSRVPAWLCVGAGKLDSFVGRFGRRTAKRFFPPWITYAHGANSVSRYSAVMTRGDLTVVPSRFLADFLKEHYGLPESKIRVVPPAVDERRFDPGKLDLKYVETLRRKWRIAPTDYVVMSVGRISPVKGYAGLIEAVALAASKMPDVKLVIVGDADRRHAEHLEELKGLVRKRGLENAVVFAGGESKIPECLSIASVVVSANTKKPESFGLSMAEALTMGKPVVAKAFGGALDIVRGGQDGILVSGANADSPEAFAQAVYEVRQRQFEGLAKAARSRFSRSEMMRRTLAVYNDVLSLPGRGRHGYVNNESSIKP